MVSGLLELYPEPLESASEPNHAVPAATDLAPTGGWTATDLTRTAHEPAVAKY